MLLYHKDIRSFVTLFFPFLSIFLLIVLPFIIFFFMTNGSEYLFLPRTVELDHKFQFSHNILLFLLLCEVKLPKFCSFTEKILNSHDAFCSTPSPSCATARPACLPASHSGDRRASSLLGSLCLSNIFVRSALLGYKMWVLLKQTVSIA